MSPIFIVIAIITIILLIIILASKQGGDNNTSRHYRPDVSCDPGKEAGRDGERIATKAIRKVLRDGDYLFTNVSVSYDERPAEMDNIIVNKYGVFIIEVKNYNGVLVGSEEEFEWTKYKDDGYGNTFEKTVRNPVKQVNRQVYILAKYLQYCGVDVWVEGYALFVNGNSPVKSCCVLESIEDIDRAIHTFKRNRLDTKTVEEIRSLLR